MWPLEKTKLASADEFPAVIDAIRDELRTNGFDGEADQLHELVHRMAWTTSNEFYGELRRALTSIRNAGQRDQEHRLHLSLAVIST
jgi:hypothetical protein